MAGRGVLQGVGCVGTALGSVVGTVVGAAVGAVVGTVVGTAVAPVVGTAVGVVPPVPAVGVVLPVPVPPLPAFTQAKKWPRTMRKPTGRPNLLGPSICRSSRL